MVIDKYWCHQDLRLHVLVSWLGGSVVEHWSLIGANFHWSAQDLQLMGNHLYG